MLNKQQKQGVHVSTTKVCQIYQLNLSLTSPQLSSKPLNKTINSQQSKTLAIQKIGSSTNALLVSTEQACKFPGIRIVYFYLNLGHIILISDWKYINMHQIYFTDVQEVKN